MSWTKRLWLQALLADHELVWGTLPAEVQKRDQSQGLKQEDLDYLTGLLSQDARFPLYDKPLAVWAAVQTIGRYGQDHPDRSDELVPFILPHLEGEHTGMRLSAVIALGRMEAISAIPFLEERLNAEENQKVLKNLERVLRYLTGGTLT